MAPDRKPLISVVTVCRNAEQTIEETLRSVAQQEGVDGLVEHIVIDGASTDGTLDIVRRFPHVLWTSEPDEGISDAFNKGMRLARGEYLLYLNADDYLFDATVLRDVAEFIRARQHLDWIVGDVLVARLVEGDTILSPQRRSFAPACWNLILRQRICHQSVFLKRQVQLQMGGFDTTLRLSMDYDLWRRLCAQGYHPVHFRRVISVFAQGGRSSERSPERNRERAAVVTRYRNTPLKRLVGTLYDRLKKRGRVSRS